MSAAEDVLDGRSAQDTIGAGSPRCWDLLWIATGVVEEVAMFAAGTDMPGIALWAASSAWVEEHYIGKDEAYDTKSTFRSTVEAG